jgi:hypothetical protein
MIYLIFWKNKGLSKNNTSGHTGVYDKKNGNHIARIFVDYIPIHIGTFETKDEAEKEYFKEYRRT